MSSARPEPVDEQRRERKEGKLRENINTFSTGGVYLGVHINPPLHFLFIQHLYSNTLKLK